MKRLWILLLTAALALSLTACGNGGKESGAPEPETSGSGEKSTQEELLPQSVLDKWNNHWYGAWSVTDGEGSCQQFVGMTLDCCAVTELTADNRGMLLLWDETGSRQDYDNQVANAPMIYLDDVFEGEGCLAATGGWFWDMPLEEWLVIPSAASPAIAAYPDAIMTSGVYETDDGWFEYAVLLRPWGTDWQDMEQNDPDLMPPGYRDWYIPCLEAGGEMPDSFF